MRYISGIQPSGIPHLGNYFGAIKQHIEISKSLNRNDSAFFFIADYHALTTVSDRDLLMSQVRDVAATYVALGLSPDAVLFRQSDIPEVTELSWLLSNVTSMGLLERAHSYKDKVANDITPSVGLFTYPVLMAADIVAYESDVVPVGKDQVQHIEIAQDIVGSFNHAFKTEVLKKPKAMLSPTPKVVGTDGRKMSKSYKNTISIFAEGKELKKQVNSIVTDCRDISEPKHPDTVNCYCVLAPFLSEEENASLRAALLSGGVGYGDLKKTIIEKMDLVFAEARATYKELMLSDDGQKKLDLILEAGADSARPVAKQTLARCLDAVGIRRRP